MNRHTTPEGYPVRSFPAIPALGPLYAKGAAGSGRIALENALPGSGGSGEPTLPPVVYRVGRIKTKHLRKDLYAYQRLVGEPVSDTMPSGFLHVLAFPLATAVMVRPDFPLPLLGMVHLANDAALLRPVNLGCVLEVRAWAENLRAHPKGAQLDIVAEVSIISAGEPSLAWRGVSTYLARGVEVASVVPSSVVWTTGVSTGGATRDTGESEHDASSSQRDWTPPYPTGRWALPADTGRAYAAVSGDRNPIHMSSLSARAFGFPRAIAHGMYTAARALAETGPTRGDTYRWTVEFAKPVLLPSKVEVAITPGDDGYEFVGWNAKKGRKHFSGTVTPL